MESNYEWFVKTTQHCPEIKIYDEGRDWHCIYSELYLTDCDFIGMCRNDFLVCVKLLVELNLVSKEEMLKGYQKAVKAANSDIVRFLKQYL